MPRRRQAQFIAIPPVRSTIWTCTIAGTDVTDFMLGGIFPHGLITEELIAEMEIDNSGENFTGKFKTQDAIIFKMDFADGSTTQFEGEVEEVKSSYEGGFFKLKIKGAHFTSQLTDVMVTKDFVDAQISVIRTSLISDNLTGFTSNNVQANTKVISIKFVNKPLLDCLIALDREGDEDTYIDFDKDFHTFPKNSKTNLNIHFTTEDSIISLRGLGTDSAEVRNKVTVYGEAGGLPVIFTSEDSASQTEFRTKEQVIQDIDITDEVLAEGIGNAERDIRKKPLEQGSINSLFWTNIFPGDKAYVISPIHKLHDLFRIVKFVFRVPSETMEVFFNEERSIPKLFKDRIRKDLAQEKITNPFKMSHSFNFTFDNQNKTDTSFGITFEDGKIKLETGSETGNMISITKDTLIGVNSVSIQTIAEGPTSNYYINADGTNNWQKINLNKEIDVINVGRNLRLRIEITDSNTRVDSAALLYK